jgi:hypothetical protein
VDELTKVQELGKDDDYIQSYERIGARVLSIQYSIEEFYLLGFLSGLKEKVADAVILYDPTALKYVYKLAKQIEKSLESQIKMLRPIVKSFSSPNTSQFRQFKPNDDKLISSSLDEPKQLDSSHTAPLTLDQKRL